MYESIWKVMIGYSGITNSISRAFLLTVKLNMSSGVNNMATNSTCTPCGGLNQSDLIPIHSLKQRIAETIPLWTLYTKNGREGKVGSEDVDGYNVNYYSINRKFTAKNFQSALDCINSIGRIAEEQNHHPDLHIYNYRDVHIELYTHKLSGVTENDILLAHSIDTNVKIDYSPKWLKGHPEALSTAKTL